MIQNILLVTLRNLLRQKKYTFINLIGLLIGIGSSLIIFLFVHYEKSYDQFHSKADRIFRIESYTSYNNNESHWAATPGGFLTTITPQFPEIDKSVKVYPYPFPKLFRKKNEWVSEKSLMYADTMFFRIFDFDFISGDPAQLLIDPYTIVLTEKIAKKYFGNENPIGKTIESSDQPLKVAGIIKDVPPNSHMHFDMIIPLNALRTNSWVDNVTVWNMYSYVLLHKNTIMNNFIRKVQAFAPRAWGYSDPKNGNEPVPDGMKLNLILRNIRDIHLNGHAEKEMEANGNDQIVDTFSVIAILILFIAAINYTNLMTARSAKRKKEIGVRKILGTTKGHIIAQFIAESFMLTIIATITAIVVAILVLPYFNETMELSLTPRSIDSRSVLIELFLMIGIPGLMAGCYPALSLSSTGTVNLFKSQVASGTGGSRFFRRLFVTLQLTITIALITCAATINHQLNYINAREPGFTKENVIIIDLPGRDLIPRLKTIRGELKTVEGVKYVSGSSSVPGRRIFALSISIQGQSNVDNENQHGIRVLGGDDELVEALGLQVTEGRDLSEEYSADVESGFLINESAVKSFGLENPIGQTIVLNLNSDVRKTGTIVGIVKDFHYASLHNKIEPLIITISPNLTSVLTVRVSDDKIKETIFQIEKKWKKILPETPFNYSFLDDTYDQMYRSDSNMGRVFSWFSIIAIALASIGLAALISFITELRTKEIGIRKVLGASVPSVLALLSREFVILLTIAFFLAIYPALQFLNQWLNKFEYRIEIDYWIFLLSFMVASIITLTVVLLQSLRAATNNPVIAIRNE